jgi:hypothetical protein
VTERTAAGCPRGKEEALTRNKNVTLAKLPSGCSVQVGIGRTARMTNDVE